MRIFSGTLPYAALLVAVAVCMQSSPALAACLSDCEVAALSCAQTCTFLLPGQARLTCVKDCTEGFKSCRASCSANRDDEPTDSPRTTSTSQPARASTTSASTSTRAASSSPAPSTPSTRCEAFTQCQCGDEEEAINRRDGSGCLYCFCRPRSIASTTATQQRISTTTPTRAPATTSPALSSSSAATTRPSSSTPSTRCEAFTECQCGDEEEAINRRDGNGCLYCFCRPRSMASTTAARAPSSPVTTNPAPSSSSASSSAVTATRPSSSTPFICELFIQCRCGDEEDLINRRDGNGCLYCFCRPRSSISTTTRGPATTTMTRGQNTVSSTATTTTRAATPSESTRLPSTATSPECKHDACFCGQYEEMVSRVDGNGCPYCFCRTRSTLPIVTGSTTRMASTTGSTTTRGTVRPSASTSTSTSSSTPAATTTTCPPPRICRCREGTEAYWFDLDNGCRDCGCKALPTLPPTTSTTTRATTTTTRATTTTTRATTTTTRATTTTTRATTHPSTTTTCPPARICRCREGSAVEFYLNENGCQDCSCRALPTMPVSSTPEMSTRPQTASTSASTTPRSQPETTTACPPILRACNCRPGMYEDFSLDDKGCKISCSCKIARK